MPAEAVKNWSDESFSRGERASESWNVLGAATAAQAEAANGIPRPGTRHPLDVTLVSKRPNAKRKSPNRDVNGGGLWHVDVEYVPQESEEAKEQADDPLKQPVKYRWRFGLQGEPFDRDIDGNPILNAAHRSFSNPPTIDFPTYHLTVTRNEKFFPFQKAMFFHNSVNEDRWPVPGTRGEYCNPGQARCLGIQPGEDYTLKQNFVPVVYEFEFRPDGFDLRIFNQGPVAASQFGTLKIYDLAGEEVTTDVPLDEVGLPYDPEGYAVGGGGDGAGAGRPLPEGAEAENTGTGVFLKYKKNNRRPFAQLGLK
jgi:hypothetical protein